MRPLGALLLLFGGACQKTGQPTRTGPQSIRLTITSPQNLGTRDMPLTTRNLTFDLDVLGPDGQVLPVDRDLELYTWFLGTLGRSYGSNQTAAARCTGITPQPIHVTAGMARGIPVALPEAFGPTQLWIEDCHQPDASFAVGASGTLWFPYPTIADVQRPANLMPQNLFTIFTDSPLEGKQVAIDVSAGGKMVVTGVFAQFYTISDTGLTDFGSLEVFSFSKPPVDLGDVLEGQSFTGAISEFNGMTELNFPLQKVIEKNAPLPPPVRMQIADFNYGSDPAKAAALEAREAAVVELDDACVCPRDASYDQFQEWTLAFKDSTGAYTCARGSSLTVATSGQVAGWDPPKSGHHVAVARGVLVNLAGLQSRTSGNPFSFFVLHPRSTADLVDAGDTCLTQ